MNRHMTLKQYRNLDLFLFAVMLIISESLIVNAAIRWFPDQLYTVSVCAAIVSIVLMRWGPWAAIHAVLGGLVYCFWAQGSPKQFLIYMIGNLFSLISLLMFRLFGKERIRENVVLTLLFALCTQLFMQMGRACVSFVMGASVNTGWNFITTDALSGLFTVVIIWIASRLDGVFEDQISYLLRVQKEAEEEKGGF
ncbi:MAG: hypothetical protein IJI14_16530 [Anaerolineaceae bacterium]|nr:hypothetical protein [Anaerolineaceae bacterium]